MSSPLTAHVNSQGSRDQVGQGYNSPARSYTWSAGDGFSFVSGVWIGFPQADHPSSQGPSKISWQSVIFSATFRWECLKVFLSWCVGSALFCLNAMMTAGCYSGTLVICLLQIPLEIVNAENGYVNSCTFACLGFHKTFVFFDLFFFPLLD